MLCRWPRPTRRSRCCWCTCATPAGSTSPDTSAPACRADYLDHLELHAGEFTALLDTILIIVTAFVRDPEAWDFLRARVLPTVLAAKGAHEP